MRPKELLLIALIIAAVPPVIALLGWWIAYCVHFVHALLGDPF